MLPCGCQIVSVALPPPCAASCSLLFSLDHTHSYAAAYRLHAWTLRTSGIQPRCLQAEYCFTAEGTDKNPTAYSLRGLDAAVYYRSNGVLNCGHAVVRTLIIDSLKHWALEYQVDGFCFVNAETLVQGE